jgi:hypothetical protein
MRALSAGLADRRQRDARENANCRSAFSPRGPLPIPGTNILPALTVVLAASAYSECVRFHFFLTLVFFGALAWGSAEIFGYFAPKST